MCRMITMKPLCTTNFLKRVKKKKKKEEEEKRVRIVP
jgi:hypothetical protein